MRIRLGQTENTNFSFETASIHRYVLNTNFRERHPHFPVIGRNVKIIALPFEPRVETTEVSSGNGIEHDSVTAVSF